SRDGDAGAHERQKPSCSHFYSSPQCSKPKYGEELASFARSYRCLPCVADVERWSIVPWQGARAAIGMSLRSHPPRVVERREGHNGPIIVTHRRESADAVALCAYTGDSRTRRHTGSDRRVTAEARPSGRFRGGLPATSGMAPQERRSVALVRVDVRSR